jgi:hypothetical protein
MQTKHIDFLIAHISAEKIKNNSEVSLLKSSVVRLSERNTQLENKTEEMLHKLSLALDRIEILERQQTSNQSNDVTNIVSHKYCQCK